MKILVVSLLRLGDIIQQIPLLQGLRAKYPEAQIHLYANKQFSQVEALLAGIVDRYIYLDREALQKGMGEAEYNILWSFKELEKQIKQLNQENYTLALNFTHNKLSAYLLGVIQADVKKGLHQIDGRFAGLENPWLRYFNDRFSASQKSQFHYVELLAKSFDLDVPRKTSTARPRSKLILMQCLTSDTKKNWGLQNFAQLKKTIEESLVDYEVCVLGAPFEHDQLAGVFGESDLLICDLFEAKKHLEGAALLISGDTSIKHLAAQNGTPIVEISLGSADVAKTGAYTEAVKTIVSDAACAPCNHSQACSQKSQVCAENISVDHVFAAVWDQLSGQAGKNKATKHELEKAVWSLYLDKKKNLVEPSFIEATHAFYTKYADVDRKSTRLNSSHTDISRMPSSA